MGNFEASYGSGSIDGKASKDVKCTKTVENEAATIQIALHRQEQLEHWINGYKE